MMKILEEIAAQAGNAPRWSSFPAFLAELSASLDSIRTAMTDAAIEIGWFDAAIGRRERSG